MPTVNIVDKPPMDNTFSSKLILPFSVVGVALIIVIGAAFILNQDSEPQPTPNPTPSPTPLVEVPEGWLTYRNEKFGFELKYPNDLVLLQEDPSTFVSFGKRNPEIIGENSLDIKILKDVLEREALSAARIRTQEEIIELQRNEPKQFPPDFNAEEFTKLQEYWLFEPVSPYPTPVQEIMINGKKALIGEFYVRLGYAEGGYAGLGVNSKILFFGDNNTYALIHIGFNVDSLVLQQILSTFRLID